jgi:hypothetical protein
MKRKADVELNRARRKAYRDEHQQERKEILADTTTDDWKIGNVFFKPENIDMESFEGTTKELACTIERLYANDGG